uniref:Uncharacterized protein n=1 Tax=Entomoneis paludosa TaxID=265537 RepID=A0A7S3DUK9_9STRA|mmetsp:Transcript_37486/g.77774  ORF Transcript_37486/g.77774 Transcript_37486/m.77774 type:complete len:127 (+) Transcript_37486:313-693(+)|eukprot:CAMPEP_0172459102 /NCGR_PEP_ID=MMETSP1065-20121228/30981_1 /TAXON_ID=265537 /ORGANISM="Amphiprora paludosa, Strain CCMP125" /LENGTH=126 /DNA_ID=CAMNT_0013213665 /DNA_START=245 /DNA_END=625 /DNA_ORIENTATION=+
MALSTRAATVAISRMTALSSPASRRFLLTPNSQIPTLSRTFQRRPFSAASSHHHHHHHHHDSADWQYGVGLVAVATVSIVPALLSGYTPHQPTPTAVCEEEPQVIPTISKRKRFKCRITVPNFLQS